MPTGGNGTGQGPARGSNAAPARSQGLRQVSRGRGVEPGAPRLCGQGEWSGKRDSNPRPSAWKADALAAELFPLKSCAGFGMVEGEGFEPSKA